METRFRSAKTYSAEYVSTNPRQRGQVKMGPTPMRLTGGARAPLSLLPLLLLQLDVAQGRPEAECSDVDCR